MSTNLRHIILLALVLLLITLFVTDHSSAAGKHCGSLLQIDDLSPGELYAKDNSTGAYRKLQPNDYLKGKGHKNFLYVISRDRPSDLHAGAIMVRTERFYSSGDQLSRVLLYRNEIPTSLVNRRTRIEIDKDVGFEDYMRFHQGDNLSADARRKLRIFHSNYNLSGKSYSTYEPLDKSIQFWFTKSPETDKKRIPRAMILFYDAINPSATCIPFYVGLSSIHDSLKIHISELEIPSGSDYVTRTWSITSNPR